MGQGIMNNSGNRMIYETKKEAEAKASKAAQDLTEHNGSEEAHPDIRELLKNASSLPDVLPLDKGGTGATDAATARTNLGAAPAYTYGTAAKTSGSSALTTGTLYFQYV